MTANALQLIARFALPAVVVTLYYLLRCRSKVSPKAEVELSARIRMGRGCVVGSFSKVKDAGGALVLGDRVQIATNCFVASGSGGLSIGDDCLLGPGSMVIANNHRYERIDAPIAAQGLASRGIRIGRDVWIGAGAVVLDGSTIEDGVIVSPNSVVSGRVPKNAIVQGNPAKVIFTRR
jgi:acetyltransferase-like isoleucine patch superfamily enzyme